MTVAIKKVVNVVKSASKAPDEIRVGDVFPCVMNKMDHGARPCIVIGISNNQVTMMPVTGRLDLAADWDYLLVSTPENGLTKDSKTSPDMTQIVDVTCVGNKRLGFISREKMKKIRRGFFLWLFHANSHGLHKNPAVNAQLHKQLNREKLWA